MSLGGVLNQLTVFTLQTKDWNHHLLFIALIHKASLMLVDRVKMYDKSSQNFCCPDVWSETCLLGIDHTDVM